MMDDPYDDFDPRNYVFWADEEAEEVVYPEELDATKIETNVYERKLSLNLSQDVNHCNFQVYPEELGSTNNETSVYEQKLSLNLSQDVNHSNFQASQQHLPASSLQPRRARKRQRAQPIPRQSHNQYDDSQAQDYSGNEEEDIFASVRSFLKNQQAPDIPCVAKGAIPTPEVNATNDASSSVPDSQVANADTMTEVVAQQEKQDPVDEEKVKEPDTNPLYARKMHGFNPEHQATATDRLIILLYCEASGSCYYRNANLESTEVISTQAPFWQACQWAGRQVARQARTHQVCVLEVYRDFR